MSNGVVVVPCSEKPRTEAIDVDVTVHDFVDRSPVTVESEDDLLVCGEELDEA